MKILGTRLHETPRVPPEFEAFLDASLPIIELSKVMGWPQQWVVCPACAQHSWIIPPHLFGPCPVLSETADSMGLKLDAERMTAVRAGNAMEKQWEMIARLFEDQLGEDDDASA